MTLDAKAFTAFEQAAHDRIARPYAKHFAPLTSLALELLLDAARVGAGQRVLDVATGPGVAAGAAYGRGADVVGVDVSPGMLALAREAHSGLDFRVAEVTALPFSNGAFDAALCNVGLGHFPAPEAALNECVRILAPGGRLAFSWWDQPVRQRCKGSSARQSPSWGWHLRLSCPRATIRYAFPTRTPSPRCFAARG